LEFSLERCFLAKKWSSKLRRRRLKLSSGGRDRQKTQAAKPLTAQQLRLGFRGQLITKHRFFLEHAFWAQKRMSKAFSKLKKNASVCFFRYFPKPSNS
jgi:hypothetical protein